MIQNRKLINSDLNIKEIDNRFVVTIDKKQLSAEYILNLMTWLQFETKQTNSEYLEEENQQLISITKPKMTGEEFTSKWLGVLKNTDISKDFKEEYYEYLNEKYK